MKKTTSLINPILLITFTLVYLLNNSCAKVSSDFTEEDYQKRLTKGKQRLLTAIREDIWNSGTKFTAQELHGCYETNELRADKHLLGNWLIVTGKIQNIGKNIQGKPYLALDADDGWNFVQCFFDDDQESALVNVEKGNYVEIVGQCVGKPVTDVLLQHSEIMSRIDPQALTAGKTYRLSKNTTLMPEFEPRDPMAALARARTILAGGSVRILSVRYKAGAPWYYVGMTDRSAGGRMRMGWINSAALIGQSLEEVN